MEYLYAILLIGYSSLLVSSSLQKIVNKRESILISLRENQDDKRFNKVWIPGVSGPGYGSPALIQRNGGNNDIASYEPSIDKKVFESKEKPYNDKDEVRYEIINENINVANHVSNKIDKSDISLTKYVKATEDNNKSNNYEFLMSPSTIDKETYESYKTESNNFPLPPSTINKEASNDDNKNDYYFPAHQTIVVSPVKTTKIPKFKKSKKPTTTTTMNPNTVTPVKAIIYDSELSENIYLPRIDGRIIDKTFNEAAKNDNSYTVNGDSGYESETTNYGGKGKMKYNSKVSPTKVSSKDIMKVENDSNYGGSTKGNSIEYGGTSSNDYFKKFVPLNEAAYEEEGTRFESTGNIEFNLHEKNIFNTMGKNLKVLENQKQTNSYDKAETSKVSSNYGGNYESNSEGTTNYDNSLVKEYGQDRNINKIKKQYQTSNKISFSKYEPTQESTYESTSGDNNNYSTASGNIYEQTISINGKKPRPNEEKEYIIEEEKNGYNDGKKSIKKNKMKKIIYENKVYNLVSEEDYKIDDENKNSKEKYDYYSDNDNNKLNEKEQTISYGIWDKFTKHEPNTPEDDYSRKEGGETPSTTRRTPRTTRRIPSITRRIPSTTMETPRTTIRLPQVVTQYNIFDKVSTTPRPTIRPTLEVVEDKPTGPPLILEQFSLTQPTTIKWDKVVPVAKKNRQLTITSIFKTNFTNLPISKGSEEFSDLNVDKHFEFSEESCYSTPRSLICCNRNLDKLVEEVFESIFKSKVHPCNFRVMTKMLNKKLESDFKSPFEVIIGPSNFATKSHFRNDLFCKKVINDTYILVYGTPEDYPIGLN